MSHVSDTQAATASVLGVIGACVLQESRPFRRDSDNEIAVAAQYCVCLWCFSIVLRYMGISDPIALIAMGVALVVATAIVFGFALWRASDEVKRLRLARFEDSLSASVVDDAGRTESDGDATTPTEDDEDGGEAGSAEAGFGLELRTLSSSPGTCVGGPSREGTDEAATAGRFAVADAGGNFLVNFCAQPQADDTAAISTHAEVLARKDEELAKLREELASKDEEIARLRR